MSRNKKIINKFEISFKLEKFFSKSGPLKVKLSSYHCEIIVFLQVFLIEAKVSSLIVLT